jgi:hypothetical protein
VALVDPIDLSEFDLTVDEPIFEPIWQQFFSEADTLDSPDLVAASEIVPPDVDAIAGAIDTPLNGAIDSLAAELALPPDPELPKAETNAAPFAASFDDILKVIPKQAFQAIPEDLQPPPELGGFTSSGGGPAPAPGQPGGPPGPVQPPVGPVGPGEGGPPPTYYEHPEVQIRNTTRTNATDFLVGETFLAEVYGAPNKTVAVSNTHSGVGYPLTNIGTTDDTGYFSLAGKFTATNKGEWYESWYVNGVLATPVLHFFVD